MNERDILTALIRASAVVDARMVATRCDLSGPIWWIAFASIAIVGALATRIAVNQYMRFIERR